MLRSRFFGCPAFNVLAEEGRSESAYNHAIAGPGGMVEALEPLNQGPVCVNWTIVARRSDRKNVAWADNHDSEEKGNKRYVTAVQTLAAAATWNEVRSSQHLESVEPQVVPHVLFGLYLPTLIIKTPELRTYDPAKQRLESTDWIRLRMMFESAGQLVGRTVDVFSDAGVATMIRVYEETVARVDEHLRKHGPVLLGPATAIRDRHKENRGRLRIRLDRSNWP